VVLPSDQPPASFTRKPCDSRRAAIFSRWSPWISTAPSLTAPPVPQCRDDGVVRVFREKGARGGKSVTVVRGLPAGDLNEVGSDLKRHCGSGGTVKNGAVEIQGDHREKVAAHLRSRGYTVKLAGG